MKILGKIILFKLLNAGLLAGCFVAALAGVRNLLKLEMSLPALAHNVWYAVTSLISLIRAAIEVDATLADAWSVFPLQNKELVAIGGACAAAALVMFFISRGLVRAFFPKKKHRRNGRRKQDKSCNSTGDKVNDDHVKFCGVTMPKINETKHTLALGTTGAGKTQALTGLMKDALDRGDTVIAIDCGGEFLGKFYDPKNDLILNPYDERSVQWSPLAELAGAWDIRRISNIIVPSGHESNAEWQHKAQTLLESVIRKLLESGMTTNKDLFGYCLRCDRETLEEFLQGTNAASLVQTERQFADTRAIVSQYLAAFTCLSEASSVNSFSIRDWLQGIKPGKRQALFVSYRADMRESLQPLLTAIVSSVVTTMLSMGENPNRRVWLFIDELGGLGKITQIQDALAQGRKPGLCAVAGAQTIAQLEATYQREGAQSLLACFNNSVMLRVPDAETAEWCSKTLGDRTKKIKNRTKNHDGEETRQYQEHVRREKLPHVFQELPDLKGYLRYGGYKYAAVTVPIQHIDPVAEPFIFGSPADDPEPGPEIEPEAEPSDQADQAGEPEETDQAEPETPEEQEQEEQEAADIIDFPTESGTDTEAEPETDPDDPGQVDQGEDDFLPLTPLRV